MPHIGNSSVLFNASTLPSTCSKYLEFLKTKKLSRLLTEKTKLKLEPNCNLTQALSLRGDTLPLPGVGGYFRCHTISTTRTGLQDTAATQIHLRRYKTLQARATRTYRPKNILTSESRNYLASISRSGDCLATLTILLNQHLDLLAPLPAGGLPMLRSRCQFDVLLPRVINSGPFSLGGSLRQGFHTSSYTATTINPGKSLSRRG